MDNKKLNLIKKNRAIKHNYRFWYKRVGRCNPKLCGGACCRYSAKYNNIDDEYHNLIGFSKANVIKLIKTKKKILEIEPINCPNITINGRCKLHNKKKQPYTCDVFPMHPDDGVYIFVKKFCSYKFVKIKNGKYKRRRKNKSSKKL